MMSNKDKVFKLNSTQAVILIVTTKRMRNIFNSMPTGINSQAHYILDGIGSVINKLLDDLVADYGEAGALELLKSCEEKIIRNYEEFKGGEGEKYRTN